MSYQDKIGGINGVYATEISAEKLQKGLSTLQKLLSLSDLNEANRENAEALSFRLQAKIYALEYYKKFDVLAKDRLCAYISEALPGTRLKKYGNTTATLQRLETAVLKTDAIVGAGNAEFSKLFLNGVCCADISECKIAVEKLTELKNKAEENAWLNPFGEKVSFPDIKPLVLTEINALYSGAVKAYENTAENTVKPCLKDITFDYSIYEYFPLPEYDEGGKANALVLCTPFEDEAKLYAVNAKREKAALAQINCSCFCDRSSDFMESVFAYAKNAGYDLIIFGAEEISDGKKPTFFKLVLKYGKAGVKVFVVDVDGGGEIYRQAVKTAEAEENFTESDVSRAYVTMPVFEQVEKEFKEKGVFADDGEAETLKNIPFAGFMGVNVAMQAFVSGGKHWFDAAEQISIKNREKALKYLSRLPSSYLLLDAGWGDFTIYEHGVKDEVKDFDYDGICADDLDNIKKIITSGISAFAKCGMIARYCLTGLSNVETWANVSREEAEGRIALATKLVFRILRVDTVPEVKVLDELDNKTAGGLCCDGGKRVLYKYSSARNVKWLNGAIVHESFHALQAKLRCEGWSKWYYENFGITRGRVAEWCKTNRIYSADTASAMYQVHIVEADARAFEVDCSSSASVVWESFSFN